MASLSEPYDLGDQLFHRLKRAAGTAWTDYVTHDFVRGLGDGSLPAPAFRHYLGQDYLFLIHFARAYALAAFKANRLSEMRRAADMVQGILNTEMQLHVDYCRQWGLSEAAMEALPEASATMAYTRYVLEKGLSGDYLDLLVALAPCVLGYGEIGARLADDARTKRVDNPYGSWIEMYAGDEYQQLALSAMQQLDEVAAERSSPARERQLAVTFEQATRLEIDFWAMGLKATS